MLQYWENWLYSRITAIQRTGWCGFQIGMKHAMVSWSSVLRQRPLPWLMKRHHTLGPDVVSHSPCHPLLSSPTYDIAGAEADGALQGSSWWQPTSSLHPVFSRFLNQAGFWPMAFKAPHHQSTEILSSYLQFGSYKLFALSNTSSGRPCMEQHVLRQHRPKDRELLQPPTAVIHTS